MNQFIRDFDGSEYKVEYVDELCDLERKDCMRSRFRIIHDNIRNIEKNLDEFKINLKTSINSFHVIVSTETLQISDLKLFNIE